MTARTRKHLDGDVVDIGASDVLAALIGKRVQERRLAKNVSVHVIAAALDVSSQDYKASERGVRRFTSKELADLCELLHTMPGTFFDNAT